MDQTAIEPGTYCLLSLHLSPLDNRGQLAFTGNFTGVIGALYSLMSTIFSTISMMYIIKKLF